MTDIELYEWCKTITLKDNFLDLPENIYKDITHEQSLLLKNYFPSTTFFRLPEKEILFFEWLKINDTPVWNDLWNDELNEPYIVSLIFLPVLIKRGYRGFPICDLLENDNYYFTPQHLADKESEIFSESAKTIYLNKGKMTVPQLLAMEISLDPIDIWHFAYKHQISVADCKKAVADLVNDEVLVHLTDASHLSTFIDF